MCTLVGLGKQLRRYVCVGLLVTMMPLALSCYGSFPMTKAVYRMNADIGSSIGEDRTGRHVVQSVVMWIMLIIPVYEVSMFADAVVLNLIEFWTGDTVDIGSVQENDGVQVALQPGADKNEAVLSVSRDGKLLAKQHVVKVSATTFEMRETSGRLNGKILKTPEGDLQLTNAQGRVIRTLTAENLAALPRS